MTSIKEWIFMGLIINLALTSASVFYFDTASQYGVGAKDMAGFNRTATVMAEIKQAQTNVLGKADEVTTFGVFEKAFTAIGNTLNTMMNTFNLFFAMVNDFNSQIGGGVIPAGALTVIEGIVIFSIVFIVMKVVFGGRFE